MMNEFKTFHPIVNFIYFLLTIGFSCFFMHPAFLMISFGCAFIYSVVLKGRKKIKSNFVLTVPLILFTALINALFNHEGVTVVGYLPDGNPLTYESLIYGIAAAMMIVSVIIWFSCYNEVMTSDKFIYLFGKIIPSLSLVISMTLRFVPRFTARFKEVAEARKCMGRDISKGNILKRIKNCLVIISSVTTWALENSIDTADSMKARGYGTGKRTAYSVFILTKRDVLSILFVIISGIYVIVGYIAGSVDFKYFPSVSGEELTPYGISVIFVYLFLCLFPVVIEIREVIRWKLLRSKI